MSRFVILLSGDITPTERLKAQAKDCPVIAADGGIRHAAVLDIEDHIHHWVGDFDSTSPELQTRYAHIPRHTYNTAKDETDGELAQKLAMEKGATELLLVGALGGRTDHAFSHLIAAAHSAVPQILASGSEEVMPIHGELTPDWPHDTEFSVLALDELSELFLKGARWPLDKVRVPAGSGWTLSNRVEGRLHIQLKAGRALLLGHF